MDAATGNERRPTVARQCNYRACIAVNVILKNVGADGQADRRHELLLIHVNGGARPHSRLQHTKSRHSDFKVDPFRYSQSNGITPNAY